MAKSKEIQLGRKRSGRVFLVYTDIYSFHGLPYHPGLASIAAVLIKNGHEVELGYISSEDQYDEIVQRILEFQPGVIGFTTVETQLTYVQRLAAKIKEKFDCVTVVGGTHITLWPNALVEPGSESLDCGMMGDSELCFSDLVKKVESGEDYLEVSNMCFRNPKTGALAINPMRPPISKMEDLPHPATEVFDFQGIIDDHNCALFHFSPNISDIKIMIFDFDGVILDSMVVKVEEYRRLLSQFTNDELQLDEIMCIYNNSMGVPRETTLKKVFKEVLNKTISDQEVDNLSQKYSQNIFQRLEDMKPINGFLEYLNTHKEVSKYIISGAPHSDLIWLTDKLALLKHFISIKGGPLNKTDEIIDIKIQENANGNEVVYFGDQKSDYTAAKASGVQFIGINSNPNLNKTPCKTFSDFQELIDHEIASGICSPK